MRSLPPDGPQSVFAIVTKGDGNCLCRALSRAYCGNESMHLEIRARIIIEGVQNHHLYVTQEIMERGATNIRQDESIPSIYAKYSDHYISGQVVTENTIDYLYSREMYDCSKIGSYLGLWQIAQAAQILKSPIHSVYPQGGDEFMRYDFHRSFFPSENANISTMNQLL